MEYFLLNLFKYLNILVDITKYCLQDLSSDLKEDWYVNTRLGTFFEEGPVMQMQ